VLVLRGDRLLMTPLTLQDERKPTCKMVEDSSGPAAVVSLRDRLAGVFVFPVLAAAFSGPASSGGGAGESRGRDVEAMIAGPRDHMLIAEQFNAGLM
jgi:hypothetical protein